MDIDLLAVLAAAATATAGLAFNGVTHLSGRRWKQVEFANQLIDRLWTDDELAFCTRALDWGVGPLIIPEKHRPLFPKGRVTMEHDKEIFCAALQPDLQEGWEKPEALTYRHSFDAFFSYLNRVTDHVSKGLIRKNQLVGLEYYLKLVANPPYLRPRGKASSARDSVFFLFVQDFYPKLVRHIWPSPPPWWAFRQRLSAARAS